MTSDKSTVFSAIGCTKSPSMAGVSTIDGFSATTSMPVVASDAAIEPVADAVSVAVAPLAAVEASAAAVVPVVVVSIAVAAVVASTAMADPVAAVVASTTTADPVAAVAASAATAATAISSTMIGITYCILKVFIHCSYNSGLIVFE